MVPSGRWKNHSGCSRTQGWSGETWIAKSIATSRPRRLAPRALAGAPVEQEGHEDLVPFFENIGRDLEHGADFSLDGIAAAVDERRDRLDDHRALELGRGRQITAGAGRLASRGRRAGLLADGNARLRCASHSGF